MILFPDSPKTFSIIGEFFQNPGTFHFYSSRTSIKFSSSHYNRVPHDVASTPSSPRNTNLTHCDVLFGLKSWLHYPYGEKDEENRISKNLFSSGFGQCYGKMGTLCWRNIVTNGVD